MIPANFLSPFRKENMIEKKKKENNQVNEEIQLSEIQN